jgi:hypothetical protein
VGTLIILLFEVNSLDMSLKVSILSKRFITMSALIILDFVVDSLDMCLKITLLSKRFITMRARIILLFEVDSLDMSRHISLASRGIFTVVTLIFHKTGLTALIPNPFTIDIEESF